MNSNTNPAGASAEVGGAAVAAAPRHTPGPWAWFDSERGPYLATPDRGRLYIMGFARKGMQGAGPRFAVWDGIESGVERSRLGGIMEDGLYLQNGDLHPDARLLEAAPDLLAALQVVLKTIETSEHWWMDAPDRGGFDLEDIRAVIAKATGAA